MVNTKSKFNPKSCALRFKYKGNFATNFSSQDTSYKSEFGCEK
jgi:hypothetical protein